MTVAVESRSATMASPCAPRLIREPREDLFTRLREQLAVGVDRSACDIPQGGLEVASDVPQRTEFAVTRPSVSAISRPGIASDVVISMPSFGRTRPHRGGMIRDRRGAAAASACGVDRLEAGAFEELDALEKQVDCLAEAVGQDREHEGRAVEQPRRQG